MESFKDVRVSVSKELHDHYTKVTEQRDNMLNSQTATSKDIVSILSATTAIIKELSRIQQEVYNAEKFAIFQQAVIAILKEEGQALVEKVLDKIDYLNMEDE